MKEQGKGAELFSLVVIVACDSSEKASDLFDICDLCSRQTTTEFMFAHRFYDALADSCCHLYAHNSACV